MTTSGSVEKKLQLENLCQYLYKFLQQCHVIDEKEKKGC